DTASAKLESLGLRPRTRMARFTLYVAGMALLLYGLEWLFKRAGATSVADSLRGWTGFLGFFLTLLIVFLALRLFRNHVMGSVRNRLIVTYLFIGVVPITLVLVATLVSAYFFVGQFSGYIAVSEINARLQSLQAGNASTAHLLAAGNTSA